MAFRDREENIIRRAPLAFLMGWVLWLSKCIVFQPMIASITEHENLKARTAYNMSFVLQIYIGRLSVYIHSCCLFHPYIRLRRLSIIGHDTGPRRRCCTVGRLLYSFIVAPFFPSYFTQFAISRLHPSRIYCQRTQYQYRLIPLEESGLQRPSDDALP